MAIVVSLEDERSKKQASLDVLTALVADDLKKVNQAIIDRMHSPVALIPQLAGHIIAAGGKAESSPAARHTYAVTLLAEKISPRALNRVADFLGKNQTNLESIRRLSDEDFSCVELTISSPSELDRHRLKRELLQIARESEMDIALQEESLFRRAKRLVVMDMDSTLITAEVIDELARDQGVYDQVAAITREIGRASCRERVSSPV